MIKHACHFQRLNSLARIGHGAKVYQVKSRYYKPLARCVQPGASKASRATENPYLKGLNVRPEILAELQNRGIDIKSVQEV